MNAQSSMIFSLLVTITNSANTANIPSSILNSGSYFLPQTYTIAAAHNFHPESTEITLPLPVITSFEAYAQDGVDGYSAIGMSYTNAIINETTMKILHESALCDLEVRCWSWETSYKCPMYQIEGPTDSRVNAQIGYRMNLYGDRSQWMRVHVAIKNSADIFDTRCNKNFDPSKILTKNPTLTPTMYPSSYPTQLPTTATSNPSLYPTLLPNTIISNPSAMSICSSSDIGYVNTTYNILANKDGCIDGIIPFISRLLQIVDVTYSKNNIFAHSNISHQQRQEFEYINDTPVCGNISVHVLTCFDDKTDPNVLLNITKSESFGKEINNKTNVNGTIIYINRTNIDVIYLSPDAPDKNMTIIWVLIGSIFSLCFLIMIFLIIQKCYRKRKLQLLTTTISKPLIVAIAIGDYDDDDAIGDYDDGYLSNLSGIEQDIKTIRFVFGNTLKYKIVPEDIKIEWTKHAILTLLKEQAAHLNSNINYYNGLMLFISGHGMKDFIFTSDYKLISHVEIHRLFTAQYPLVRDIPRIVMFDCCAGSMEKSDRARASVSEESKHDNINVGKCEGECLQLTETKLTDEDDIWNRDEHNPDFKLVTVMASNEGFQSKMSSVAGSYCISEFVKRIKDNYDTGNKKFLYDILDDVQEALHSRGKQLIECKFNNNMRYIKFVKNNQSLNDKQTEMELQKLNN